nr:hypothetical protein [Tanacetum cinerariifolium]
AAAAVHRRKRGFGRRTIRQTGCDPGADRPLVRQRLRHGGWLGRQMAGPQCNGATDTAMAVRQSADRLRRAPGVHPGGLRTQSETR